MRQPEGSEASFADRLSALLQSLLPTRLLSALMFRIAEIRNRRFKRALIRWFMHKYPVDLADAAQPGIDGYEHFNAFFTRALHPGARPQPLAADAFSCPVDGAISQLGPIRQGTLIQAKGHRYSVADLIADEELAKTFWYGSYCTIYLAPHNYHRVHMPCVGRMRGWAYVPGRLFSVNPRTARAVPQLFARNERMVAVFDTLFGPMVVVMVGALLVGGIETVWNGRLTPPHRRDIPPTHYEPVQPLLLQRGEELGRFHMGSTVILLCPPNALTWKTALAPGREVCLGEVLATMMAK
ncbi:MAG: archaetidylserine decarboxylase [Nevskia sp.]|nr:archaetidylserine decarboxylase [Nevskia sp.]